MKRRDLLKMTASTGILAAPRIARAEKSRALRFVPIAGVSVLDPVWTAARPTRDHGYMVFDTLYGIDENLTAQPQMAAGHTIDDGGKRWTITLRDKLRFHDGQPVLAKDVVASIKRFCVRDQFGQFLKVFVNHRRGTIAIPLGVMIGAQGFHLVESLRPLPGHS